MAKVVHGHRLKNNEYLLIRVYDEQAARTNWIEQAIAIKSSQDETKKENITKENIATDVIKPEDLKMGRLLIIKGTDVSFFIPPTGVEVAADTRGEFVREAVSLEQIEYCQLVDQNGSKRYERGPKVVFPKPTERFITAKEDTEEKPSRKFRAIELNPNSGIYIKIIADYKEDDKTYTVGEELFITGKDQPIYFPREEHAIIKYGDEGLEQEIHYGIAIPKGEARYVMDRDSGDISLVKGPRVFLPDPRKQVIVRRIIEPTTCQLLYPGNIEALNAIMQYSIEDFYRNSTSIIRDTVLGTKVDETRPGVLFEENGMRIYDVEVLDVTLLNKEIQNLITSSERDVINNNLKISAAQRGLDFVRKTEKINQDILTAQAETRKAKSIIEAQDINDSLKLAITRVGAKSEEEEATKLSEFKIQEILDKITGVVLARTAKSMDQEMSFSEKKLKLRVDELMAQTDAAIKQGEIFTPGLIAALQRFGDDDLLKTAVTALGPMAALKIAGGDSIANVLQNIFKGSNLEKMLPQALGGNGNGSKSASVTTSATPR